VEFIPIADVPAWSVLADECIVLFVPVWFVPCIGLLASFIPMVEVFVSFIPVFALPVSFMPVILLLALDPAVEPLLLLFPMAEAPDALVLVPALFVALPGVFWALVLPVVAEVPLDIELSLVASAAKAGAAASSPNAQTEASRRPLSMFNSLPMPLP
jgi:hypothetical protein